MQTYVSKTGHGVADGEGEGVVYNVHVLAEPVDESARGRCVEEAHWRAEDVEQHRVVEVPGRQYGAERQGVSASRHRSHCKTCHVCFSTL